MPSPHSIVLPWHLTMDTDYLQQPLDFTYVHLQTAILALFSQGPFLSKPTSLGILLETYISELEFTCRYIYLGLFDSEVEAAR